jgi:hypothetical protein
MTTPEQLEWMDGAIVADTPAVPVYPDLSICRHPPCGRPVVRCGCPPPLLGWSHRGDRHGAGSHFCGVTERRHAEPEPEPATTLYRFMTALPGLRAADPPIAPGDKAADAAAIAAAEWRPRWCAFCLVAAGATIICRAAELGVDGIRLLDLCRVHFADLRRHMPLFGDAEQIAAWRAVHGS